MQPTLHDVHVDAILTNISVAYIQNTTQFIAPRVFPAVPVDKQSDKYYIYDKGDWFRDEAKKRAPATESEGSGYHLSNDSYGCDVWALHKDVADQIRMNADAGINVDQDASEFVMSRLMLRLERQWAADFFVSGVWATDMTGQATADATHAVFWNDYLNSDPIGDVEKAKRAILLVTGYRPNKLVIGYDVWVSLKNHPDLIDRYKYTTAQVLTEELVARLFGVNEILVAESIVNTANEGATPVFSFIHGKNALLCYTPPAPALQTPSAGYTFLWRGISAGLGEPAVIRRFRMEHLRADRVEGELAFDNKVVAQDMGYFFSGIVE